VRRVTTFVVRIYNQDDEAGELNGAVDEVSSGRRTMFADPEQLLAILAGRDAVHAADERGTEDGAS
jgi:hypothetical protein